MKSMENNKDNNRMSRKGGKKGVKAAAVAALCCLVSVVSVGSTYAYLTSNETAANISTVGSVQTDLEEPNWPGNSSSSVKNLVPNQEVKKDPLMENTGNNKQICFMKVSVPMKNTTLVSANGTKGTKSITDIFYLKDTAAAASTHANSVHTGKAGTDTWTLLSGVSGYVDSSEKASTAAVDGGYDVYIYGYNKVLAPGEKTSTLFDKIQLKNCIEGEISAGAQQKIIVRAYAIQADYVLDEGSAAADSDLSEENLTKIYNTFYTQSGEAKNDAASSGKYKNLTGK